MNPTPPILIANWKMNLTVDEGHRFVSGLTAAMDVPATWVGIAPMAVAMDACIKAAAGSGIKIGAQNCHWEISGAYTGELSASILKEMGAGFALVGHSERRSLFLENSQEVAKRALGAVKAGLTAAFCIGETLQERESGTTLSILKEQLTPLLSLLGSADRDKIVLAYEPVWAIGTGVVATLDQIEETHSAIAAWLLTEHGWHSPSILYGGSVKPDNYAAILSLPSVHGALVGGASLKLESFLELLNISEHQAKDNGTPQLKLSVG
jgi:triosephosphate isomerase (TIM)